MEITRLEHLTFGTLCQSNYPTPSESNDPARITWLIKKDKSVIFHVNKDPHSWGSVCCRKKRSEHQEARGTGIEKICRKTAGLVKAKPCNSLTRCPFGHVSSCIFVWHDPDFYKTKTTKQCLKLINHFTPIKYSSWW